MTLVFKNIPVKKITSEVIFFRISDCAKNVMGYTVTKCHDRISFSILL
jgi:hypothetical protein